MFNHVQEFLKVCTLQPGDVFGMTSLFTVERELVTSLVSRGCECVIINKDMYSLLLNRDSKDALRDKVLLHCVRAVKKYLKKKEKED